jgi:hypothetical protein
VSLESFSLNVERFVELKKQSLTSTDNVSLEQLEITSQSINRWVQYCQYHYFMLQESTSVEDLRHDKFLQIRRKGENVKLRFVYEANIAAFLNSLHALLDSFPYLLNLFIPVMKPDSQSIKWNINYLKKYKEYDFYDELITFMLDEDFNKVKGYVNTIKHKHLVRVANCEEYLEFESFNYKQPNIRQDGTVEYDSKIAERDDVMVFLKDCHNELIPNFFGLCKNVLATELK